MQTFSFADDGRVPNNPRLPMIVHPRALDPATPELATRIEQLFASHGWPPQWRYGIYPFIHYHSVCHEALGVARGHARVRFGGERGIELELEPGDVVVLPAGTGHQNLASSPDFLAVGAYPEGSDYDLCRGEPDERPRALEAIARVPLPATDPVLGDRGGVTEHWR